jgi:sacsin
MILADTVEHTDIRGLLKKTFLHSAREALLFVNVEKVEAQIHSREGIEELWSVTSMKSSLNHTDHEKEQRVSIMINKAGSQTVDQWHIVTNTFSRNQLPPELTDPVEHYRIPRDITTGIAVRIPNSPSSLSQYQQFFYSTLRLPVHTSLPVHINAPFILAPDRRVIRFDGLEQLNPESRFNCWLLDHLIPPLYCRLLGSKAIEASFQDYLWPGNSDMSNENPHSLTSLVIDAFFIHFPDSRQAMCRTTSGLQLDPYSSRFAGEFPNCAQRLLSLLGIMDVVFMPDKRVRTRILASGVQEFTSDDFLAILKENGDKLSDLFAQRQLKSEDIWSILQYIIDRNYSGPQIDGIRILPLGNNTIGHISSGKAKVFVKSLQYIEQFPRQRFVHCHIPPELVEGLINLDLNVFLFDDEAVQELMMERLPKAAATKLSEQEKEWVDSIWDIGEDIDKENFMEFPVVPTSRHLSYISIKETLGEKVLFCPPEWDKWVIDYLADAGAICVMYSSCHPSLLSLLSEKAMSFSQVLDMFAKGILHIKSSAEKVYRAFLQWLQSQIEGTFLEKRERGYACQLPIWIAFNRQGEERILRALDIYMLPSGLKKKDIRPFIMQSSYFIEWSFALSGILDENRRLTLSTLREHICLPNKIDGPLLGQFRVVLQLLMHGGGENLSVPNTNGDTRPLRDLYSISDRLFSVALCNRLDLFLHPGLRDLDSQLRGFGLRYGLNSENFVECATAIHRERFSSDILQRARDVFDIYDADMPFHLQNDESIRRQLNDLSFIPRARERREGLPWSDQYGIQLPMVVSPNQVLRGEFEALAWSQRARFERPPSRILLAVEENLGEPNISEIVSFRSVSYSPVDDTPVRFLISAS